MNILPAKNISHVLQVLSKELKTIDFLHDDINIIVPDKFSLQMEKFIFEALNIDCSFNINITTINRFCKSVINNASIAPKMISKIGTVILTQKILKENENNLKCFNSNNFSYKYSSEVSRTLAQLNSSMADANKMKTFTNQNVMLQNKINDLGTLLQEYNNQKAGLLDSSDIITQAIFCLDKKQFCNTYFFFVGFDDFTFQGYALIEQLTKICKSTFLTVFENEEGNNHYIYPTQIKRRLSAFCKENNIAYEIKYSSYEDNNLKKFLADNLFSYKNQKFLMDKQNKIKLYSALSKEEEIDFIARDMRKQILSGKRYKDFGVLCFGLEGYTNLIERTFAKYEIAYYVDNKKSLYDTAIMKFFCNLLKLKNYDFSNINLIEHITNPYCNFSEIEKQQLLNFLLSHNYYGSFDEKKTTQEIAPILKRLYDDFYACEDKNKFELSKFWQNVKQIYNLNEKIENNNQIQDLYSQKIISQTIEKIDELVEQIEMWHHSSKLTDVIEIVINSSKEMQIAPLPLSLDCVQILDAKDNFTFFDNLYLVNCQQTTCPSYQKDCGIILDYDIAELGTTVPLSPTINHLNSLSKISAYNAILSFNENLTISMNIKDENEKSSVVNELEKKILFSENVPLFTMTKAYLQSHENDANLSHADAIEKLCFKNEIQDCKRLNLDSSWFMPKNEISPSQIETYYKCPFVHFMNYGLRLKQNKSSSINSADIGTVLHALAQHYYSNLDLYKKSPEDFCKNFVKQKISFRQQTKQNKVLIENLIQEAGRFLNFLEKLDNNSKFQPNKLAMEYSFSQSLFKTKNNENIKLLGTIDRIDFYNDGFRIIDYKSGKAEPSLKELYYGQKLQLFLYGNIAQQIFSKDCKGVFYLPIKNKFNKQNDKKVSFKLQGFYLNDDNNIKAMDKNFEDASINSSEIVNINLKKSSDGILTPCAYDKCLTKSQFDKFLQYAQDISSQAINELIDGNISPSPFADGNKTSCEHCAYLHLCKKNSRKIETRTAIETIKADTVFGGDDE